LLVLVLVLVDAVAVGGTASAHTGLSSCDPADGAVLTAPPATVTLVFDGPMVNIGAAVVITGPDGQQYPTGTPVVDSTDVRTDVPALGPAGQYTVIYRVISGDGHAVEGQIRFQLDAPVPATSATADIDIQPVPAAVASPSPPTASELASSSPTPLPTIEGSAAAAVTTWTSPTTAEVTPSAISEPQDGVSGWWWAAAVVLLILVAAGGGVIIRQRRTRGEN
jgi:methionine-rich copper-binding protein CopC